MPLEDAEAALERRKPGTLPSFEVWKENVTTFEVFIGLQTQWYRVTGLAGTARTGLMYAEARLELRERGFPRARRNELMDDLRAMERAALETWNGDAASEG